MITDQLIERAVELWCRALKRPSHDNGDKTKNGFMAQALSDMLLDKQMEGITDYDARIEKFRAALIERLKAQRRERGDNWSFHLGTDYNPDPMLADAAMEAGIPSQAFSYKSTVYCYGGCVSAAFGYGVIPVNHYPMGDGDWLITTLRDDSTDIGKVIDAVKRGVLMLPVEHWP